MELQVGDRVLIAKHKATVRYVGAVEGHDGVWVGVEWDDPGRGKHDGSTGGRRYFSCASGGPAGSLVRLAKVGRGAALEDALLARYTNRQGEGQAASGAADAAAFVSTSSSRKVWVQLVGEEQVVARLSQTELLASARLVGMGVSHVACAAKLASLAPSLTQLDLTDNLLGRWASAAAVCVALPQLASLNLSSNCLALPGCWAGGRALPQLPGLRCLVLNQCAVTWQQVGVLQSSLPQLTELHVCGNGISSLRMQPPEQPADDSQQLAGFMSLQVLGLEDNALSDWQEVARLAGLPRLRSLGLSGNPLPCVRHPAAHVPLHALWGELPPPEAGEAAGAAGAAPAPFAGLQVLLLGGCRLGSWADVDQLNSFPSLRELRLSGNPLLEGHGLAGRRFEVIGRVARLTLLNGADVKPRERRDCELRYLQHALAQHQQGQQQDQQQQQHEQGQLQHPRLAELQAKYGHVVSGVAGAAAAQQGSSLQASSVLLLLQHGASSSRKKLPRSITVGGLKLLCSRLFKLPVDEQQLLLARPSCDAGEGGGGSSGQQPPAEDISGDDTKQLAFWDVADGCVVLVVRADADAAREAALAQAAAAALAHERLMQQQLQDGDALRCAAAAQ